MSESDLIQRYRAVDGREFETEEEAYGHSVLVQAKQKFDEAQAEYAKVICEQRKTADGYPFRLGYQTYYRVVGGYFDIPGVVEVRFDPRRVEVDESDFARVIAIHYDPDEREYTATRIDVGDLYCYRKNALRRCAELMRERLEGFKKTVEDFELLAGKG